jgi:uncharacterized protein YqjF (DUF2071 family)
MHWEVDDCRLRELLPGALEIDRWDGASWVSAVAFRLAKVQLRGLPAIPLCTDFLELNLRTYVRYRGEPGISFLSMHADSRVAVAAARWLTPLPYRYAPMTCRNERSQWHWRCGGGSATQPVLLDGRFEQLGAEAQAVENSLDDWLVERYAAFVPDRRGRLHRMVCEHAPWELSPVACDIARVGSESAFGLPLSPAPELCHFASKVESRIGPFEPL